jgi:hypothetical protein
MAEELSPQATLAWEEHHQEDVKHKLEKLDEAEAVLRARRAQLLDGQKVRSGDAKKEHAEFAKKLESMSDAEMRKAGYL